MGRLDKEYDTISFGMRSQMLFELSPFYFCTFEIGGKKWRTLIHYWVASYFRGNPEMMEIIRNLDTPEKAIRVGERHGLLDFNQINPKELILAVQERFNQNDSLRMVLLSTGLVNLEYRGKGFLADGNRYGKVLMKVREIYANE